MPVCGRSLYRRGISQGKDYELLCLDYKLGIKHSISARCDRHPRYDPIKDRRVGIRDGCATCWSLLLDLTNAKVALEQSPCDSKGKRRHKSHTRELTSGAAALPIDPRMSPVDVPLKRMSKGPRLNSDPMSQIGVNK